MLAVGGRALVFAREIHDEDESIEFLHRRRCLGIYRYSFETGTIDRADYDLVHPRWESGLAFAGSPDGERVAIVEGWQPGAPGFENLGAVRLTLLVTGFTPGTRRVLLELNAGGSGSADDVSLQWSPDGTRIALAVTLFGSREDLPIFRPTLLILDVATGREIFRFEGVHVVGSASWSPDGNRILVADSDDVVRILDLTTQELSPVPFLPGPRKDVWERGAQRTLGFAAADRLLVATQRGKTMTISTVATATGAAEPLIRWTGAEFMYPVLAQMPAGYWD